MPQIIMNKISEYKLLKEPISLFTLFLKNNPSHTYYVYKYMNTFLQALKVKISHQC